MVRRGIDHLKRVQITSLYFLFFSLVSFFIFKPDIIRLVPNISIAAVIALGLYYLVTIAIHYWITNKLQYPKEFIRQNPYLYFAPLDWRHIVSNSFIILFQQVLIVAIISIMQKIDLSVVNIIFILIVLSFIVHIPLTKKLGKFWGWYFAIFSMIAAVLYPILILYVPDGVVYAFIIQSVYYSLSGIGVWLIHQHKTTSSS